MQFQVHLAAPDGRVRILRRGRLEEGLRTVDPNRRRALQRPGPVGRGQHLPGGSAAAVAVPERDEGRVGRTLLPVLPFGPREVTRGEVAVVRVHGREVSEHLGAVDPLPPKRVVRHLVGLVPGDLLGQEVLRTGGPDDLRQGGGVAEGVRQPDLLGVDPEPVEEVPLAGHELARHRLAAGHVGVGLDPHAADGDELPVRDRLRDPFEQFRVVLLDPGVLLGRGAGEPEVGIGLGELENVGERPSALADRLPHRPQPGRVDVGVTDGDDPVRAGVRRTAQHLAQLGPGGRRGAGDVVGIDHVEHRRQGMQDLEATRLGLGQLVHQPIEGADVAEQLPDSCVEQSDLELADLVDRVVTGGGRVAERGGREVDRPDVGVRRGLEIEVDGGGRIEWHVIVERCHRLDRHAVRTPGQPLGLEPGTAAEAEVDDQLGGRAGGQ